jgi:hypothetical protein
MPASQDSLRFIAVGVGVAIVVGAGFVFGMPIAILALAALALLGGIALIWSSVQSLTGETPLTLEEALTLGAPSAEEEQKRAVLRALKDLEYERSVGKITNEDYQQLSARYRAEAIRLMQRLDENLKPARARAEKLLQDRLIKAGLSEKGEDEGSARVEEPKPERTERERAEEPKLARAEIDETPGDPAPDPSQPVQATDTPEEAPAGVTRLAISEGGKS